VVITGSAMREAEVFTLVAQRIHAPLLVDVQSGGVVDGEGGLRGHERVGLVERPITCFVYRPERREVYEQLRHFRFIEHGAVDAVEGPAGDNNSRLKNLMRNKFKKLIVSRTYLRELTLSLVMPLQLAMNMPMDEFSSVQISLGVASGSPCAALPLALLYATTR